MADWEQQYNDHPVHETLRQAQSQLGGIDKSELDEDAGKDVERLEIALPYVHGRLSTADYNLVSRATLDGLNGHLTKLHA